MAALPQSYLTPEEYIARERAAETKSEYFRGEMFAMAGATRHHNLISINVSRELTTQLKGRPCEAYAGDMRVRVSETGLYTYPDVVVVCGEPRFEDGEEDTLLNPTLLVEVLSKSTEAYDRGEKAGHYRRPSSLRELVLIGQNQPRVERYRRQAESAEWLFCEARELTESVVLDSIGCRLALSEVYDRVRFGSDEDETEAG